MYLGIPIGFGLAFSADPAPVDECTQDVTRFVDILVCSVSRETCFHSLHMTSMTFSFPGCSLARSCVSPWATNRSNNSQPPCATVGQGHIHHLPVLMPKYCAAVHLPSYGFFLNRPDGIGFPLLRVRRLAMLKVRDPRLAS